MKLKDNVFVSIFLVITFGFIFINESIYKNILSPLQYIGFFLIFASILYSLFLSSKYKKAYITLNIVILILAAAVFLFNMPEYTYKEAQSIIAQDYNDKGHIIDIYNEEYKGRMGLPHINIKPGRNILVKADYLVYLYNKTDDKIEWYRFNAVDGAYELYDIK